MKLNCSCALGGLLPHSTENKNLLFFASIDVHLLTHLSIFSLSIPHSFFI